MGVWGELRRSQQETVSELLHVIILTPMMTTKAVSADVVFNSFRLAITVMVEWAEVKHQAAYLL